MMFVSTDPTPAIRPAGMCEGPIPDTGGGYGGDPAPGIMDYIAFWIGLCFGLLGGSFAMFLYLR